MRMNPAVWVTRDEEERSFFGGQFGFPVAIPNQSHCGGGEQTGGLMENHASGCS